MHRWCIRQAATALNWTVRMVGLWQRQCTRMTGVVIVWQRKKTGLAEIQAGTGGIVAEYAGGWKDLVVNILQH